jgi:hypothetical protein
MSNHNSPKKAKNPLVDSLSERNVLSNEQLELRKQVAAEIVACAKTKDVREAEEKLWLKVRRRKIEQRSFV